MLYDDVLYLIWKKYYSHVVLCEFDKLKYVSRVEQNDWELPVSVKFDFLRRTYIYE